MPRTTLETSDTTASLTRACNSALKTAKWSCAHCASRFRNSNLVINLFICIVLTVYYVAFGWQYGYWYRAWCVNRWISEFPLQYRLAKAGPGMAIRYGMFICLNGTSVHTGIQSKFTILAILAVPACRYGCMYPGMSVYVCQRVCPRRATSRATSSTEVSHSCPVLGCEGTCPAQTPSHVSTCHT